MSTKPSTKDVLAIIDRLEGAINDSEFIPAVRFYRTIVVLGLVSKTLTVARAVCVLVDAGFPGEAFGLCRTMIDIYLTVRYISNKDTEERAKRFAEFYTKDHAGWTGIIQKFFPSVTIPNSESHKYAMEKAKTYRSAHQWTGMGDQTRQMAIEEDSFECDAAGHPLTCEFDYEVIYKWTSFFVHSTVSALECHLSAAREVFRIRAQNELIQARADDALFSVLAYLSKTLIHAFRAIRGEPPQHLLDEIGEMLRAYTNAEVGRK
jgi:hypothetical protein